MTSHDWYVFLATLIQQRVLISLFFLSVFFFLAPPRIVKTASRTGNNRMNTNTPMLFVAERNCAGFRRKPG